MYQSILHFIEKDVKEIEKIITSVIDGDKDITDLSLDVQDRILKLGSSMVGEIFELIDEEIFNSIERKKKWYVEHKDEPRTIVDVMGTVTFKRRGYVPKSGGKNIYLLDELLGLDGHQKVTLAAAAKMLEEAIETSYSKAGKALGTGDIVSKETIKGLVHETECDMPEEEVEEKKALKNLHIVCDEDHVSAQFWNKKGDLRLDKKGNKINTLISKIIVLYEDVIDESPEDSDKHRYKLIGKHTFCGMYKGEVENIKLWQEVEDYIEEHYDKEILERVYIAGDGAAWIKAGKDIIWNGRFVLDKFHMMKYINKSITHLENEDDMRMYIWECINGVHKEELKEIYDEILSVTKDENKYNDVLNTKKYLLNNWEGIDIRHTESGGVWKCCAEGQVSHVLSSRLSSRPMGWSEKGCDNMSHLRAYTRNNGKIIELLKYRKENQERLAHRKEQDELIKDLRKRQSDWGYSQVFTATIPGLENSNMKWLEDLIRRRLNA